MKTSVNAGSLKNHFTYSWWKYILVLLAGTFLVNLLFTVTRPKVPEDKRVDLYVIGYADQEKLNAWLEEVRLEELPDMESVSSAVSFPDETYGAMIVTTYFAAQEGDLYLLPRDQFLTYSAQGAFVPLEEDRELMDLFNEAGLDLRRGWRTLSDSDETHLYGIPLDALPGLNSLCYVENGFLAVTVYNGNMDNVMKFCRILCRDMITAPVEEGPAAESPAPAP